MLGAPEGGAGASCGMGGAAGGAVPVAAGFARGLARFAEILIVGSVVPAGRPIAGSGSVRTAAPGEPAGAGVCDWAGASRNSPGISISAAATLYAAVDT
jgi:hypothetical protein